jgi:pyruvate dehydrogenase E2 component (dihydrolipoamide acetyltransferase)
MEMEAFEGGTIAHIAAGEGAKVPVGAVMAVLATGKEKVEEIKKKSANASAQSAKSEEAPKKKQARSDQAQEPEPVAASAGSAPSGGGAKHHSIIHASNSEMREPDEVQLHGATRQPIDTTPKKRGSNGSGDGDTRLKASPLARRIAGEKGIDLARVPGSGPNGRIIRADVESFKPSPAGGSPRQMARGSKEVIALTKIRTVIAQRLQQSKQNLPHFYETIDIDVEALSSLREKLNKRLEKEKIRVSISDFVNKSIASALLKHPALNAHFNGQKNEITRFGDVNLGIAVALPDGLIVPVLRSIDQLGITDIRQRSVELAEKARAGRLKQDELSGATFTVSTLGMYGIREFSAIINPPEVGILAIGAAEPRAVVRNGQIVARQMMTVTLSVDHRAVDGATAAEFLGTLRMMLEEPAMMFM